MLLLQSSANPPAPPAAARTILPEQEYAPREKSAAHKTPLIPHSFESAPDHRPSPTGTARQSKSSSPSPISLSQFPLTHTQSQPSYFRGDFRSTTIVSPRSTLTGPYAGVSIRKVIF